MMTDAIADMLTRIRNANRANHLEATVPYSKIRAEIARVLHEEGFIQEWSLAGEGTQRSILVRLKPRTRSGQKVLTDLRRVSRPGLRKYVGKREIPRVVGGLGVAILSTPQGLMTGQQAQRLGVGGEVLAYVW